MKGNTKNYIKEVFVEDLFGYYTYKIPLEKADTHSQLLIVYGDNGSGKTTILEMIFSLLSIDTRGVDGILKLCELKFTSIGLTLDNGVEIFVYKEDIDDDCVELFVTENGAGVSCILYSTLLNDTLTTNIEKEHFEAFLKVHNAIDKLNITVFYLSDNRKFAFSRSVDGGFSDDNSNHVYAIRKQLKRQLRNGKISHKEYKMLAASYGPDDKLLLPAIKRLEKWIHNKALQGSRQGEKNTNTIYKEMVKRIAQSSEDDTPLNNRIDAIKTNLEEISKQNDEYAKFGLVSSIELQDIIDAVSLTQDAKLEILYSAIEPYIEGLSASFDSLREVQELILSFIESINSYLTHKEIQYHLSRGFTIIHKRNNEPIPFSVLSSGERQLLLLICNVITASEEATIFIIDEPEISLNVKWQRKLLDTLLKFGENRNIQFIIATHSIELLTGHISNVARLENVTDLQPVD